MNPRAVAGSIILAGILSLECMTEQQYPAIVAQHPHVEIKIETPPTQFISVQSASGFVYDPRHSLDAFVTKPPTQD